MPTNEPSQPMTTEEAQALRITALETQLAQCQKERDALRLAFAEASHNAGPAFVAHEDLAQARREIDLLKKTPLRQRVQQLERDVDHWCDLHTVANNERDAARREAAMIRDHENKALESDSIIASCGCLTKTDEVRFHKPGCKYRLISERDAARREAEEWKDDTARARELIDSLRTQLDEANGKLAMCAYQAGQEGAAVLAVKELRVQLDAACEKLEYVQDKLESANQAAEGMREALEETDKALAAMFWTSDDGNKVRLGTPEDEDAPMDVTAAWEKIQRALSSPIGQGFVRRENYDQIANALKRHIRPECQCNNCKMDAALVARAELDQTKG